MNEEEMNEALKTSKTIANKAIESANRAIEATKRSKTLKDYENSLRLTEHARNQLTDVLNIIQQSLLNKLE